MQQESSPTGGTNPPTASGPGLPLTPWQQAKRVVCYSLVGALAGVFAIAILALLALLEEKDLLKGEKDWRKILPALGVIFGTLAAAILGIILGDVAGMVIGAAGFGAVAGGAVGFVWALKR